MYLHAFPDGTRAEPDRPRKQLSSEGNVRVRNHSCYFQSCSSLAQCSWVLQLINGVFVWVSSVCLLQFMNNVRLWDFIEEREQQSTLPLPSFDDDITELRELFMQMSGPGNDGPDTPPTADQ